MNSTDIFKSTGIIATLIGLIASIICIVEYLMNKQSFFIRFRRYIKHRTQAFRRFITRNKKENANSKIFNPFPEGCPEGIEERKKLKRKRKFDNEVFAIELLTKKIQLDKKANAKIDIFIDRRDVDYAVVTSKGKSNLNKAIIPHERVHSLLKEDIAIQSFLNNSDKSNKKEIELENDSKVLRWASGGVLAIVEYEGEYWIPMFYRDIEPHGWNLFLGSTERYFNENEKVINNIEDEFNFPTNFIAREFLEELLIFKEQPDSNKEENVVIPLALPFDTQNNTNIFNEKHIKFRKEYDNLNIVFDENYIDCKQINTNMALHIISPKGTIINRITDVIICFNLLELGIEVVKVIKFKLDSGNVLLDGEILSYLHNDKYKEELVRMPIALVSCDFLEKHFKGDLENLGYVLEPNSSVKIEEDIENNDSKDFILFDYDLKQRLKFKRTTKDKEDPECKRYEKSFKNYFEEINPNIENPDINNVKTIIRKDFTRHFTPAAAKILNLFFNQVDPKEYKKL